MKEYQTQQRSLLLTFFAENPDIQFTIEELKKQIAGISISAVYRNINQMVAQGQVRRFQKEGSRKFCYQYIGNSACAGHLHMKCNCCGSISHLDTATEQAVQEVLRRSTRFQLDMGKTVLQGFCICCDGRRKREVGS